MGTKWKMPIAVIGKPTGDGRQFDEGALSHRDLPLPLRYVPADSGGHANAVIVGHISKMGREKDGMLPAQGEFYDDESWPEDVRNHATAARKFTANKVIGPSVDLDQAEMERVPEPKAYAAWQKEQRGKIKAAKLAHAAATGSDCGCSSPTIEAAAEPYEGPHLKLVRSGRVASTTLVHIPAFAELAGHAVLTPIDSHDPNADGTTASVMIENDEEMGSDSGIWLDDDAYEEFARKKLPRPSKDKGGDANIPTGDGEQSGGAAWAADVTDPAVRRKIDSSDFVDPKGRRFPIASCADIADAVSSYGRANPKIPYGQFKSRLTAIAKRKGCADSLPDDWKAGEKMASLMAGAAPVAPPKEWFEDPKLTGPTGIHISDDGRVYGHVAVWDTCHVGIGSSCVKPPRSLTSYAYFHTGEVVTAEGERIAVGRLSYGGGHAAPNLGYRAAAEHYDQTSNMGAMVRAGEDQYGIWVAGAVNPDVDDKALSVMRATPLSGDWRRIGSNLEMMAALHVNTPGFPVPREMIAASAHGDVVLSLTAAGAIGHEDDDTAPVTAAVQDPEELGRAIARGILAEQHADAEKKAREAEWAELVAAAQRPEHRAVYDEVLSDLLVALVE